MKTVRVVIKLGGSLLSEAPELIDRLIIEFGSGTSGAVSEKQASEKSLYSILIVPGGGIFTDAIRRADERFGLGDDAAHWMAVLGMEQYACYLQDKSRAQVVDSITELPLGVSILFPYRLLKAEDPLPHSWDVTSDTIAAWVAKQVGALFIKATDVDGIFREGKLLREIFASDFSENFESCVDPFLPGFLQINRMECRIINGKFPERVIQAVYGKPVPCTTVKGNI
ncbi:amino acid kinase [Methanosarcina sp. WH1]|uniref:amino acid kinase family protein n=1 Tax=Methanosarcina sp. WH1 TaxID=1434102 RepID=UPI000615B98B|nr:amino acid kinase [Methanosarcina sp. WH1]AKB22159.1 delta 1-pyrroline-5-carboxylate synthetase [Methanosarcina sp. WH1]